MKTEVTYRGGSGAQGNMEVVVECGKCGGKGEVASWHTPWLQVTCKDSCWDCHGTGREVRD